MDEPQRFAGLTGFGLTFACDFKRFIEVAPTMYSEVGVAQAIFGAHSRIGDLTVGLHNAGKALQQLVGNGLAAAGRIVEQYQPVGRKDRRA